MVLALAGATVWRGRAQAQQPLRPVIGFLDSASPATSADLASAFREGLRQTGFSEDENIRIAYRWAEGSYDLLPRLAADLVKQRVAVIAAAGNTPALAAKAATTTIPIVFVTGTDPVQGGLVASLNRPSGNITGITSLGVELGPKRLELLHEVVPHVTTIALLVNPSNRSADIQVQNFQAAAVRLGRELHVLRASSEQDIDAAFATLVHIRAGALVIAPESFFNSRSGQLAGLSVRYSVPTIYTYRPFAAAGGLMSYGANITAAYRQAGVYVGRILKGEKPADMPVEQSADVELIVNLKTARTLGLTIPLSVLGRADEVIE
jgi:putative ABC transport system substrate-binding protein